FKGICSLKGLFGDTNPKKMQSNFLNEVFRILKPHGLLYIGIENRLSYQYFLGMPEEHIRLKYIALLPRIIANIYSGIYLHKMYRNYTYTYWGYRKLLKSCGFQGIRFYGMKPNYSISEEILDIDYLDKIRAKKYSF